MPLQQQAWPALTCMATNKRLSDQSNGEAQRLKPGKGSVASVAHSQASSICCKAVKAGPAAENESFSQRKDDLQQHVLCYSVAGAACYGACVNDSCCLCRASCSVPNIKQLNTLSKLSNTCLKATGSNCRHSSNMLAIYAETCRQSHHEICKYCQGTSKAHARVIQNLGVRARFQQFEEQVQAGVPLQIPGAFLRARSPLYSKMAPQSQMSVRGTTGLPNETAAALLALQQSCTLIQTNVGCTDPHP